MTQLLRRPDTKEVQQYSQGKMETVIMWVSATGITNRVLKKKVGKSPASF